MNTIIHPVTGKIYNISSNEGLYIIDRYMNTYKRGGNASNLDALIKKVDVLTGGAKRLFSKFVSSDSDDELMPLLSDKKLLDMKKRKTFITTLPSEIQEDIDDDSWSGSSSGIHRKEDTYEINLVETDNYFFKFIPETKIDEIDNIYEKLGTYSMQMGFPIEFYIPLFKYPVIVTIDEVEYGVYRLEKWGESLEDIKRRGELYHSKNAPFHSAMRWLQKVLGYLQAIGLTHGDILKSGSEIHWGNILAKQENGVWEFKLIDFGNEMSDPRKEIEFYYQLFGMNPVRVTFDDLEMLSHPKTENYIMLENKVNDEEKRNINYKRRNYSSFFSPSKRQRKLFEKRRLFESSEEDDDEAEDEEGKDISMLTSPLSTHSLRPPLPPDDMFGSPVLLSPTNRTTPEGALRPILTPPPLTPTKKESLRTSPLWNIRTSPSLIRRTSPSLIRRTSPSIAIRRTPRTS